MVNWNQTISEREARQMSPVVLAFVGDAVFTLLVRKALSLKADYRAGELNKMASAEVSAHGQSLFTERIFPLFTEEEKAVFLRGRNAKKPTKSKHASVAEYNLSTGLEAVIGYLYLTGQTERIDTLLEKGHAD